MARGSRLAIVAAAALASCSRSAPGGPVPLAVAPSQGTAEGAVELEIVGNGFVPTVRTDYGDTSRSALDARFTASLFPSSGGDPVPLDAVTLTPRGTLTARVPAGIATGPYDLMVVDPAGRSGRLPDAYRVVTPAESVAGFQLAVIDGATAGIPFRLIVTAVDVSGRAVDAFTGTVTVEDATSTVSPGNLGPFARGRAMGFVTVTAVTAQDRIVVRDVASPGRSGTSNDFAVRTGPAVAVAFVAPPDDLSAGSCSLFEIGVRDVLGQPSVLPAPLTVRLDVAPPGAAVAYPDAGCGTTPMSSVIVAAGTARVAFRLRAGAAGAITLRLVPESLPSTEHGLAIR